MRKLVCMAALSFVAASLPSAQKAANQPAAPGTSTFSLPQGWSVTMCLPGIYCGSEEGTEFGFGIEALPDGGAAVVAAPYNSISESDPRYLWLARHNASGGVLWEKEIVMNDPSLEFRNARSFFWTAGVSLGSGALFASVP